MFYDFILASAVLFRNPQILEAMWDDDKLDWIDNPHEQWVLLTVERVFYR